MKNGDINFGVTEDVNVKIHMPSAFQNQIVGDANLCQNAWFTIIFICLYNCSFPEKHITCMSFWILYKNILISTIKFSRTEIFEVQHKHAIKGKNNSYFHLLPHV